MRPSVGSIHLLNIHLKPEQGVHGMNQKAFPSTAQISSSLPCNGYRGALYPRLKRLEREADDSPNLVSRLRMREDTSPLPHTS